MENPATWSKATWIVHHAIVRHNKEEQLEIIGLSLPAMIVQMLTVAGYLTEEAVRTEYRPESEAPDLKPEEGPLDFMPNK